MPRDIIVLLITNRGIGASREADDAAEPFTMMVAYYARSRLEPYFSILFSIRALRELTGLFIHLANMWKLREFF